MKYLFCLLFATMVLTNTSFGQLTKLTDFKTQNEESYIDQMYNFNDSLTFIFGVSPSNLWKYNNVKKEFSLLPTTPSGLWFHFVCGVLDDKLIFFRGKTGVTQLVSYNVNTGNIEVLREVKDAGESIIIACKPIKMNNKYYFVEGYSNNKYPLIETDGTANGTKVIFSDIKKTEYLFTNSDKLYGSVETPNGIQIIHYPIDGNAKEIFPEIPKMKTLYEAVTKDSNVVFLFGVNKDLAPNVKNYIYEYNLNSKSTSLLRETDGEPIIIDYLQGANSSFPFQAGSFVKELKNKIFFMELNNSYNHLNILSFDKSTFQVTVLGEKICGDCLNYPFVTGFNEHNSKLYFSGRLVGTTLLTIYSIDSLGVMLKEYEAGDNNVYDATYSNFPRFEILKGNSLFNFNQNSNDKVNDLYSIDLKTKQKTLVEANLETFYYHKVSPAQTLMMALVDKVFNLYVYNDITTATKNLQLTQLYNIAPNPSNGYWQLNKDANLSDEKVNYIVTDINGREITKGQSHGAIEINGQHWANGVYILSLKTNTLYQTVKLIKQ